MFSVEVESNGVIYKALSRIESRLLIVSSPTLGSKCCVLKKQSNANCLAEILLRELIADMERI